MWFYQPLILFMEIKKLMTKYNLTDNNKKDAVYRTLVSPLLLDKLEQQVLNVILIQKRYRDKNYSANLLAKELQTNTRYIAATINMRFHMNYASFVNKFRIDDAMSLLKDKRYQNLNMEEISDMVGFANRQSFYAAFYKFNQCTPREYKLKHSVKNRVKKQISEVNTNRENKDSKTEI